MQQSISEWARFALTGDPSSQKIKDNTLAFLEGTATQETIALYPSLLQGAPGTLTGNDLAAFQEAAGYLLAAKVLGTPGGAEFLQLIVSRREENVSQGRSAPENCIEAAQERLRAASAQALLKIAEVRESVASQSRPAMVALSGRRRSSCSSAKPWCH